MVGWRFTGEKQVHSSGLLNVYCLKVVPAVKKNELSDLLWHLKTSYMFEAQYNAQGKKEQEVLL